MALKKNLFFGFEDNKNVERRSVGKNCEYLDDCGVWKSMSITTFEIAY